MKIIILIIFFFFLVNNCDAKRRHKNKSYRIVKPATQQMIDPKDLLNSLHEADIGPDDLKKPATNLLLDLYQQLQKRHGMDGPSDDVKKSLYNADTIRTFNTKVAVYEGKGKAKFTFNLTSLSDGEIAQYAELHVRAMHRNLNGLHRFRVSILNEDGQKEKRITVKLAAKSVRYDGYLVFDITDIIRKVIDKTNGDFERVLELSIQHKGRAQKKNKSKQRVERDVSDELIPELTNDDGVIVVYSQDSAFFEKFNSQVRHAMNKLNSESSVGQSEDVHDRRSKREANEKDEKPKGKLCTKKDFMVDFDALGWGRWIVYPKKYNAYMCSGKCPNPVDWSFNPTNHAIIQSLMRLKDKKISRPCCAPTKLEPLSMLYHEYGEIVVRHHEGMVATKCGCR